MFTLVYNNYNFHVIEFSRVEPLNSFLINHNLRSWHTFPLQLKHGAEVKAALLEFFDGVPGNVRQFKSDVTQHIKMLDSKQSLTSKLVKILDLKMLMK
jgi:hypothetical protein